MKKIKSNLPIYDAINDYISGDIIPFHMPGHKFGNKIPDKIKNKLLNMDVTEVPGLDNLHFPEGAIKEAQELAKEAFGADKTYFLVNGSSCGIHSIIMSICSQGDKIIVNRDCHKSVINGMLLAGVEPIFIKPDFIESFSIPGTISIDKIKKVIQKNKDAKAVFLTSPNYYGICSDIENTAKIAHDNNMILAVDEAHGAHLNFNDKLPPSAITIGADICVQSAHKTLPSLTQTAYLHVKYGRIDTNKLEFNLRMLQSSSPSYLFMLFLDYARDIMQTKGDELLGKLIDDIDSFEKEVSNYEKIKLLTKSDIKNGDFDKTKIVLNVKETGKTGYEIEKYLKEKFNIQVEMSDLDNVLCIVTISDKEDYLNKLSEALEIINREFNDNKQIADIYYKDVKIPLKKLTIKDAYLKKGKIYDIKDVKDKICKEIVTPYPPGVPVICPGEVFTEEIIEYIINIKKYGGQVNGLLEDNMIEIIDSF